MNWPNDYIDKVICGDCLDVMRAMPDNSIDTIITDPPYGIGFMGKEWDTFRPDIVDAGVKRSSRKVKVSNPESRAKGSAGFEAGRYDRSLQANKKFQAWFTGWGAEALRVLKPGGTLLIFGGTRTYHRLACGIEDAGFTLKDCIMWLYGSGFPKATDISKQLDKKAGTYVKGEISPNSRNSGASPSGCYDEGVQHKTLPNPQSEESKLWNGWKSHGLKPAYEPILVAMKPNDGTYAANALKHGVSGLNIDGGRIPLQKHGEDKRLGGKGDWSSDKMAKNVYEGGYAGKRVGSSTQGRFPANIILDEEAAAMLDEQSGVKGGGKTYDYTGEKEYQVKGFVPDNKPNSPSNRGDSGGASRFFYCAKASKAERNAGCEGLEEKARGPIGKGLDNTLKGPTNSLRKDKPTVSANNHPTVKPLALMEYLCKLTKTPTGGIVLDPFTGSGTTGIACVKTGRQFVGVEKDKDYCEIACKRIESENKQIQAEKDKYGLFGEKT